MKLDKKSAWLYLFSLAIKLGLIALLILPNLTRWYGRFELPTDYDDVDYYRHALCMAESGQFVSPSATADFPDEWRPTAFRTPGYPFLLMLFGRVSGWNPLAMLLIQSVFLSFIPVVALSIIRKKGWPVWPAWLLAIDPLVSILSVSFMTEGWMLLLLLLAIRCWLEADRAIWRIPSFLLYATAILIKPTPQFFAWIFLLLTLVFYGKRLRTVGAFAVGMLPVLLWMLRNLFICGIFAVSTQSDNAIWAKYTIMALEEGYQGCFYEYAGIKAAEKGQNIGALIIDNEITLTGEVKEFILENKGLFIKYHTLGSVRMLFGTARVHFKASFLGDPDLPDSAIPGYNEFMIAYYLALYAAVALLFRFGHLADRTTLFSVLFTGYNVAMIGVFAYMTGGGLKRTAFVPFLYLILAHGATMKGKGWPLGWIVEKVKGRKG